MGLEEIVWVFANGEWGESESSGFDCELNDLIIAVIIVWVIVPKKLNPKAVMTEICFLGKFRTVNER